MDSDQGPSDDGNRHGWQLMHIGSSYIFTWFSYSPKGTVRRMSRPYQNKSMDRGLRILDLFNESTVYLTASEIAKAFRTTPATLYPTLCTLVDHHYLTRDERKRYSLGLKLLERSGQVLAQLDVRHVARPYLRNLARQRQATSDLGILYGSEVLYLERRVGHPAAMVGEVVGRRVPLHCTSIGKVLLAFLPPAERRQLIASLSLESYTPNTIVDTGLLAEELDRVVKQGYAVDMQEFHLGSSCVGAPIRGHGGNVIAALSLMLPVGNGGQEDDYEAQAQAVIETAGAISKELGYTE
jgi:IclR family transcriptional regulator, KDG regulon repressor